MILSISVLESQGFEQEQEKKRTTGLEKKLQ